MFTKFETFYRRDPFVCRCCSTEIVARIPITMSTDMIERLATTAALAPSQDVWARLCAELDVMADDDVRDNLADLERLLAHWPAVLRVVPAAWADRLVAKSTEPRTLLCRQVDHRTTRWEQVLPALQAPDGARIEGADVSRSGLDSAHCGALADLLARTHITTLSIRGNTIGVGLGELLAPRSGGKLRHLDAASSGIESKDILELKTAGIEIELSTLSVAFNYLSADSVANLAGLTGFSTVERLSLAGNKFGARGVTVLVDACAGGSALRDVDLEGTQCGDDGAASIANAAALERLETLSLAACSISDEGARSLAIAPSLAHLRALDLRLNAIAAEGAAALISSRSLAHLRQLLLYRNPIDDDLVAGLAHLTSIMSLEMLALDSEGMSEGARAELSGHSALRSVTIDFV